MMKRVKLRALLALIAIFLPQSHLRAGSVLVMELTTGQTEKFVLQDKPELTMTGTKVTIKSLTLQTSYERSNVSKFYFVDATAIKEIRENTVTYRQTAQNQLTVSGLTAQDVIIVSSLAGHVISDCVERTDDEAIIELNGCPKGIYIIKIGHKQTIKIAKK